MSRAILVKELSGVSRRWQTYLGRVVYVGLIALILLQITHRLDLRHASEYATLGRSLFYAIFTLQMFFVPLMAISSASDMVSKEVRAGTLGLLAITPLSPSDIVVGKWKASVLYALSLFLCGIPVLAASVYLGGVGLLELLWSTCLTGAAAALAAAVAILYSCILRAGYTAIIAAILTLMGYTILPAILTLGIRERPGLIDLLYWTHLVFSAVGTSVGDLHDGSSLGWIGATGVSLGLTWILLRQASRRVARRLLSLDPGLGRVEGSGDPGMMPTSLAHPVWEDHPILWKELRTRGWGGLAKIIRVGLLLLLFGLVPLSAMMMNGNAAWKILVTWCAAAFFILMVMACGVSLFVREKEGRQWEVLLSTPISAWQIISAKVLAGTLNFLPLTGILLLAFTLLALLDRVPILGWLMTWGSILLVALFGYVLGAAMSLRAGSIRSAFTATFGVMGFILVFLPIMLAFYSAFPGMSWDRGQFPFILVTVSNPGVFLVPLSEHVASWSSSGSRNVFDRVAPYFGLQLAGYGTGILLVLLAMRARFPRITGRAEAEA